MKLKIVHQQQQIQAENGHQQQQHQPMKEEDQEEEPSPITTTSETPLVVSGKRKRKPKELFDEFSPIIRTCFKKKKKNNKSSAPPKSEHGTPDGEGTAMSKGDGPAGGSSSPVQLRSPSTLIRAEEFEQSLGNDKPTFKKVLVRSHVGSCFWMGLPVQFCKTYLPLEDATVVIENENGEEFPIKYIAHKTGLSAGWRKFVVGNKLVEGDVLIYQFIGPCRFKVYIIRANDLTEVDGALSLLILDSQTKQNGAEGEKSKRKRRPKSLPLTVVEKKKQKEYPLLLELAQPEEHSGNDSDEVASEVLEGSKSSQPHLHFKNVKSFEQFRVVINGACIDSELPEETRRKYYELCCSKKAFLHDRVLPGLYRKLAAGMIFETISIADDIRGCKLTTPKKDFEVWEKSLRSFELLGLNVGFLRARLRRLQSLAFDSEGALVVRRYWEVQKGKTSTEDEIEKLEAKLQELRQKSAMYDHEIDDLKMKAESYELKFQEEVDAPW